MPQPSGECLLDVITRVSGLRDQGQDTSRAKMAGPTVPIVYGVSFADPAGYFLATRVQMRNKDVIFAANAQQVEITKFADFLNTLISVLTNGVLLANGIQTNRILFHIHTPNPTAAVPVITTTP